MKNKLNNLRINFNNLSIINLLLEYLVYFFLNVCSLFNELLILQFDKKTLTIFCIKLHHILAYSLVAFLVHKLNFGLIDC